MEGKDVSVLTGSEQVLSSEAVKQMIADNPNIIEVIECCDTCGYTRENKTKCLLTGYKIKNLNYRCPGYIANKKARHA